MRRIRPFMIALLLALTLITVAYSVRSSMFQGNVFTDAWNWIRGNKVSENVYVSPTQVVSEHAQSRWEGTLETSAGIAPVFCAVSLMLPDSATADCKDESGQNSLSISVTDLQSDTPSTTLTGTVGGQKIVFSGSGDGSVQGTSQSFTFVGSAGEYTGTGNGSVNDTSIMVQFDIGQIIQGKIEMHCTDCGDVGGEAGTGDDRTISDDSSTHDGDDGERISGPSTWKGTIQTPVGNPSISCIATPAENSVTAVCTGSEGNKLTIKVTGSVGRPSVTVNGTVDGKAISMSGEGSTNGTMDAFSFTGSVGSYSISGEGSMKDTIITVQFNIGQIIQGNIEMHCTDCGDPGR